MANGLGFVVRRLLMVGLPAAAGVGVYVATDSILYGALALVGAFTVIAVAVVAAGGRGGTPAS